ncbi:Beta-1,3-galactosyltransferase 1 [Toxocara canis]|uniref:Hexosyltransferase n=1 Tax=Toxocara canis TaxID=6265 RepID=A0A0B2W488_TOXCA|nr:Beta-1,3-galactosyltransferase 1 [Toxocara canis]
MRDALRALMSSRMLAKWLKLCIFLLILTCCAAAALSIIRRSSFQRAIKTAIYGTGIIFDNELIARVASGDSVDPYRYNWLVNQANFCTASYTNLKFLIIVHSAVDHFMNRLVLRQIYGTNYYKQYNCVMLFVLGRPAKTIVQRQIEEEAGIFNDIIQQDFIDSYRNLTWKAIAWLRFVSEHCIHVKYVIKIDDDVLFNIFTLVDFLNKSEVGMENAQKTIICRVIRNRKVQRNSKNKWYVRRNELVGKYYLPYCVGMAIVISGNTAASLLEASTGEGYFWIDDYFITGILAAKTGASFVDLGKKNVVVHESEGSEQDFVSGKILFRLFSNIIHARHIWEKLRKARALSDTEK